MAGECEWAWQRAREKWKDKSWGIEGERFNTSRALAAAFIASAPSYFAV